MRKLIAEYNKNKERIKKRLEEFKNMHKGEDRDIFQELCFCLLTPQSKAVFCDAAVRELKESGALFKGDRRAIRNRLSRVRFPNNKAGYIVGARRLFSARCGVNIKERLDKNIFKTRDWLVRNVKGLGYKEASHFLRNIGLGRGLAILDVHILRNLKRHGVIKKIPSSISKKNYIDIENKMKRFSEKVNIPLEELDLLFWHQETGLIFK